MRLTRSVGEAPEPVIGKTPAARPRPTLVHCAPPSVLTSVRTAAAPAPVATLSGLPGWSGASMYGALPTASWRSVAVAGPDQTYLLCVWIDADWPVSGSSAP